MRRATALPYSSRSSRAEVTDDDAGVGADQRGRGFQRLTAPPAACELAMERAATMMDTDDNRPAVQEKRRERRGRDQGRVR
jgi:hypothetical protein